MLKNANSPRVPCHVIISDDITGKKLHRYLLFNTTQSSLFSHNSKVGSNNVTGAVEPNLILKQV